MPFWKRKMTKEEEDRTNKTRRGWAGPAYYHDEIVKPNNITRNNKYFKKANREVQKREFVPHFDAPVTNRKYVQGVAKDWTKENKAQRAQEKKDGVKPDWDKINSVANYVPFSGDGVYSVDKLPHEKPREWSHPDFDTYGEFLKSEKGLMDDFMDDRKGAKDVDRNVETKGILPSLKSKLDALSNDKKNKEAEMENKKPIGTSIGTGGSVVGKGSSQWEQKHNDSSRTNVGRTFDALMLPVHLGAGAAYGAVEHYKESEEKSVLKSLNSKKARRGMKGGLMASNPLGDGHEEGKKTYSNVFEVSGWKPESTSGKIARGVTGFVADVALDPTTYMTGGLSALIKGSGRVGAGAKTVEKAIDRVPMAQFDNKINDLVGKGVNKDLAERLAISQFEKNVTNLDGAKHFTNEMAEHIVKNESIAKGITKTADELAIDGHRMADQFNKTVGIRDVHDVTFGLGNLPFAPKVLQKTNVTIGSAEGLQKIADKSGIANAYQGIRNGIYGTSVGRKLTNQSSLHTVAQESPGKFWNTLEHFAGQRGKNYDKAVQEADILAKFEAMDLKPHQQAELIDLMEDKTISNAVQKRMNMSAVEDTKEIRKAIEDGTIKSKTQLDELVEKNKVIKSWERVVDNDLLANDVAYQTIENSRLTELADFDVSALRNVGDQKKIVGQLESEVRRFDHTGEAVDDVDALKQLFEGAKKEEVERSKHMAAKYNTPKRGDAKLGRDAREEHITGSVIDRMDKAPSMEHTNKLNEALNSYVYGEADRMVLSGTSAEKLMAKVEEGASKAELQAYAEKNPHFFDAHTRQVNTTVAGELDYTEWGRDGFRHPMAKLNGTDIKESNKMDLEKLEMEVDAKFRDGELTPFERDEYIRLKQKKTIRLESQRRYRQMSQDEMSRLDMKAKEVEYKGDFGNTEDEWLDMRRSEWEIETGKKADADTIMDNAQDMTPRPKIYDIDKNKKRTLRKGQSGFKEVDRGMKEAPIRGESEFVADRFKREFEQVNRNEVAEMMTTHKMFDSAPKTRKELETLKEITNDANKMANFDHGAQFNKLSFKEQMQILRKSKDNIAKGKTGYEAQEVRQLAENENMRAQVRLKRDADIQKVVNAKSPTEIFNSSTMAQNQLGRKNDVVNRYNSSLNTLAKIEKTNVDGRLELVDKFTKQMGEQKENILKLEGQKQQYRKAIQNNETGEMEKLKKEIESNERAIADDEALEVYLEGKTQNDIALIANHEKYAKVSEGDTIHNHNGLIDLGNDGSAVIAKDIKHTDITDYVTGKDGSFASPQHQQVYEELAEEGWTQTRMDKMLEDPDKAKKFLVEYEKAKTLNLTDKNYWKQGQDLLTPDKLKQEVDSTRAVLEQFETINTDKLMREASPIQAGRAIIENRTEDKKVSEAYNFLRESFMEMGEKELSIGKLGKEQFEANMYKYLPRVLTKEGEKLFSGKNAKVVEQKYNSLTGEGMGTKSNKFAKTRQTEGTVKEVNEYFAEQFPKLLKGNNAFSENVADIYLARAMQHTDLMYDQKYMDDMVNVLGSDIPMDGAIEAGKSAVINHGKLRSSVKDITSMKMSNKMSEDVSNYVGANVFEWNARALNEGVPADKIIGAEVSKYVDEAFPDKRVTEMFTELHNETIQQTELPFKHFDDEALPMQTLKPNQMDNLNRVWNDTKNAHTNSLQNSLNNALNRSAGDRVEQVIEKFSKLGDIEPPNVKQVNNNIINQTNQAMKSQRAKDENAFLSGYDKLHHLVKLQQTTVIPGFHTRNKAGNMFNNWLELGRRAFDKDLQGSMTALARAEGNLDGVAKYIEDGRMGGKRLAKGFDMPKAHPSVQKHMTDGNMSADELYKMAEAFEVVDTGRFVGDAMQGKKSKGLLKFLTKEFDSGKKFSLDPTNTEDFLAYKIGTNIGTPLENGDRLLHFTAKLQDGHTYEQAAESVRKHLFDYSDITGFEESVMKRVMPYYTWTRKNARLQVGSLIDKPGKYRDTAKGLNIMEGSVDEEDQMEGRYTQDWMKEWIQLPWKQKENEHGDENPMVLSPNLPYLDGNELPDLANPKRAGRKMFGNVSPLIRAPAEMAINKNVFFRQDLAEDTEYYEDGNVKKEAESKTQANIDHAITQAPLINQVREIYEDRGDRHEAIRRTSNLLTGLKINAYNYDYEKSQIDGTHMDEAKARQITNIIEGFKKNTEFDEKDYSLNNKQKKATKDANDKEIEELEEYLEFLENEHD